MPPVGLGFMVAPTVENGRNISIIMMTCCAATRLAHKLLRLLRWPGSPQDGPGRQGECCPSLDRAGAALRTSCQGLP